MDSAVALLQLKEKFPRIDWVLESDRISGFLPGDLLSEEGRPCKIIDLVLLPQEIQLIYAGRSQSFALFSQAINCLVEILGAQRPFDPIRQSSYAFYIVVVASDGRFFAKPVTFQSVAKLESVFQEMVVEDFLGAMIAECSQLLQEFCNREDCQYLLEDANTLFYFNGIAYLSDENKKYSCKGAFYLNQTPWVDLEPIIRNALVKKDSGEIYQPTKTFRFPISPAQWISMDQSDRLAAIAQAKKTWHNSPYLMACLLGYEDVVKTTNSRNFSTRRRFAPELIEYALTEIHCLEGHQQSIGIAIEWIVAACNALNSDNPSTVFFGVHRLDRLMKVLSR